MRKQKAASASATTPVPVPPPAAIALVLRTCDANRQGHGGFQWPESGPVAAPDWSPAAVCGRGLHGLLHGEGVGSMLNWEPTAQWLVVEVDASSVVQLDGKVKFPRGVVVHCGDRLSATAYLREREPGRAIVGSLATAGYGGTATAGYGGTATAGDGGTATAGYGGTATAGYRGTATAGYGGTATAGDRGTATAGDGGTATAGDGGTATAGDRGTATAGYGGTIQIRWWDGAVGRYRLATLYVDEGGILPRRRYRLDGKGQPALVEEPAAPTPS